MTDIKTVWKNQLLENQTMLTLDDLHQRAQHLRGRFQRRNLLLYVYSVLSILASAWLVATRKFPNMQAPMLLMVGAHLFVLWQVWKRFGRAQMPPQASGQNILQFHRRELERQHAAVERAGLWYIAPFIPPFLWELAIWLHNIDLGTAAGQGAVRVFAFAVFSGALFWSCVWLLFSRHAARLELELERLSRVMAE